MFMRSSSVSFCFCKLQLLRVGSNEHPGETSQLGYRSELADDDIAG
jgi:hypothetical protein